jgi:hypothetical protein
MMHQEMTAERGPWLGNEARKAETAGVPAVSETAAMAAAIRNPADQAE